jgi:hypothetical protein
MNFVRTLVATIMIAAFAAIVLAQVPLGAPRGTLTQSFLGGASLTAFSTVFLAIAGVLAVSFVALLLLEEKPLADAQAL